MRKNERQMSGVRHAYLDVSVSVCPHCGALYADASWYVIGLESDVECGTCGNDFNPKKTLKDRVLIQFDVDEHGNVVSVEMKKQNR